MPSPARSCTRPARARWQALGEVPFGLYYGSVDSTPLFVLLARAYFDRTGDHALIAELWPNIEAALGWMEQHGDIDRDGFLEYNRKSEIGLTNQGWKDSVDSIFHADGALAEPPIALCEVQGYAYAAWAGAAALARALGKNERANVLSREGDRASAPLRGRVLVRGARHLCARARRPEAAMPREIVQRGPGAVHRHRRGSIAPSASPRP